jgi:hypothetical protein
MCLWWEEKNEEMEVREEEREEGGAAVEVERVREREQQQGKERERGPWFQWRVASQEERREREGQSPNSSFSSFLFL